jgi:hypothetical protein
MSDRDLPDNPAERELFNRLAILGNQPAEVFKLIDDFAHALAERIRSVHASGEGDAWNWWDAAEIPGNCADLIDPYADRKQPKAP